MAGEVGKKAQVPPQILVGLRSKGPGVGRSTCKNGNGRHFPLKLINALRETGFYGNGVVAPERRAIILSLESENSMGILTLGKGNFLSRFRYWRFF